MRTAAIITEMGVGLWHRTVFQRWSRSARAASENVTSFSGSVIDSTGGVGQEASRSEDCFERLPTYPHTSNAIVAHLPADLVAHGATPAPASVIVTSLFRRIFRSAVARTHSDALQSASGGRGAAAFACSRAVPT